MILDSWIGIFVRGKSTETSRWNNFNLNFTSLNVWFAFFNSRVCVWLSFRLHGLYYSLFEITEANERCSPQSIKEALL